MQQLILKKNEDRRIRAGHLWVFSNEVDVERTPLTGFAPGEPARLVASSGRPLALVTVSPGALICARVMDQDPGAKLNREWFKRRLGQALGLRERLYAEPFYRLAYSEGDLLPGLIIDRFDRGLSMQTSTAAMEGLTPLILEALDELLAPEWILAKNDMPLRDMEGLAREVKALKGTPPERAEVLEGGIRFQFSLAGGQKTGWFYDQRENRLALARLCKGARVLDVYCYAGGFGVAAAAAGAEEVALLDASEPALEQALDNAETAGVAERVTGLHGDAAEGLAELAAAGERYDVISLDPPAFIKRRKDHAKGLAAYQKINRAAVELLAPGGLLLSCSCSRLLAPEDLAQAAYRAAGSAHRPAQIVWRGRQGSDHPAHPAMPETEYLKAVLLRALDA